MIRLVLLLAALPAACGSEDDRNPVCSAPCEEIRPGEFECPC
jgi:hypothetical protein